MPVSTNTITANATPLPPPPAPTPVEDAVPATATATNTTTTTTDTTPTTVPTTTPTALPAKPAKPTKPKGKTRRPSKPPPRPPPPSASTATGSGSDSDESSTPGETVEYEGPAAPAGAPPPPPPLPPADYFDAILNPAPMPIPRREPLPLPPPVPDAFDIRSEMLTRIAAKRADVSGGYSDRITELQRQVQTKYAWEWDEVEAFAEEAQAVSDGLSTVAHAQLNAVIADFNSIRVEVHTVQRQIDIIQHSLSGKLRGDTIDRLCLAMNEFIRLAGQPTLYSDLVQRRHVNLPYDLQPAQCAATALRACTALLREGIQRCQTMFMGRTARERTYKIDQAESILSSGLDFTRRLLLHTSADWDDGGLINLARKKQTAIRALPREDGYVTSFTLGDDDGDDEDGVKALARAVVESRPLPPLLSARTFTQEELNDAVDVAVEMGKAAHTSLRVLLEAGASPNGSGSFWPGKTTPLHVACRRNDIATVAELLRGGADCDVEDDNGFLPTHLLARKQFENAAFEYTPIDAVSTSPFARFYNNETFSDITFVCEGKEIRSHRLVVCTFSEYFSSALESGLWAESESAVYPIEDVSCVVFEALLRYMYTRTLFLTPDDVSLAFELLIASDRFGVSGLAELAGPFLAANVVPSIAIDLLKYSRLFCVEGLADACYHCLLTQYAEIEDGDEGEAKRDVLIEYVDGLINAALKREE